MQSIRVRLTVYYSTILLISFLTLGWTTYKLVSAHLLAALERDLSYRCHALTEEISLKAGQPTMPEQHTAFEGSHSGYAITDAGGRLILEHGLRLEQFRPAHEALRRQRWQTGQVGAWRWRSEPIVREGRCIGMVLVAENPVDMAATLEDLGKSLLAFLPILGVVSGTAGWILAGRALKPVEQLAAQIEAMGEADLNQRLPARNDELGNLSSSFNHLIERLEKAFQRQKQFTADASHELRTPLATILALTSQKLMRPRESEDYARALQEIHRAAGSLSQLVASLLFLARADSGAHLLDRESIQLTELLEAVTESLADTYPDLQLQVEGKAQVCGDITLLTRLFTNLLENAVVHGQATMVQVELIQTSDQVLILLRDNGRGLQAPQLPRLLERFYQGDSARHGQGAGLGLSICLSIVQAHGGDLLLALTDAGGLAVTVKFHALITP